VADPSVKAMATAKTIAVGTDTLLVDDDTNAPVDSLPFYNDALSASGPPSTTWDLAKDPELPPNSMKAFKAIVWFTGNSYPGPLLAYEARLHITWDGTETQNDKPTRAVHEVAGTRTAGVGAVPIDRSVLQAAFEDQITPNGGA
jgi:hypothetical protein